jgi:hypothetical protein
MGLKKKEIDQSRNPESDRKALKPTEKLSLIVLQLNLLVSKSSRRKRKQQKKALFSIWANS